MNKFVHLHLHSFFSDGVCDFSKLADKLREQHGAESNLAIALTDHGTMRGILDFYETISRHGIKPIIGFEANVISERISVQANNPNPKAYHLVLLAKDVSGYSNLCKLCTEGQFNLINGIPVIDKEKLAEHSEGIIALSACLNGEVMSNIMWGNLRKAKIAAAEYKNIFGSDNFYIEIMDHKIIGNGEANKELVKLARELEIPLVATNDVHYIEKSDSEIFEIYRAMQKGVTVNTPSFKKLETTEYYLKSPEEMQTLFKELPDALDNTWKIAERCNVNFKEIYDSDKANSIDLNMENEKHETIKLLCSANLKNLYGIEFENHSTLTAEQKIVIDRLEKELLEHITQKTNHPIFEFPS